MKALKVQSIFARGLGVLILLLSLTGFRTFNYRWAVSQDDPTVWVRFCSKTNFTSLSFDYVVKQVLNDFNSIQTSYVRLDAYPDDLSHIPATEPGQSTFTPEKAGERTIDVCFGEASALASGGHANTFVSGNRITYCEIVLIADLKRSSAEFTRTLTHELGHCLGLDHPQETIHAIMSYYQSAEAEPRLKDDDKMGLSYLYPKQDVTTEESPTFGFGCAPFSN